MHTHKDLLVFTDLDGTLLDYHTYSKEAALPALRSLQEHDIPLVIVSSKTRAEIELMLDLPCMSQVFIVENGSAIFFRRELGLDPGDDTEPFGEYEAVILGMRYGKVLDILKQTSRECGVRVRGFSDMDIPEIASLTGLDIESAARAKQREFSEPFLFEDDPSRLSAFIERLEEKGLSATTGGRFHHVLGRCDKGRAAKKVVDVYKKSHPGTARQIVALGDSANDIPLLESADVAVIVRRHDNSCMDYTPGHTQEVIKPAGIGPVGWNEAVLDLIRRESLPR